jgi:enoyl-CoA hydratase/carnithine racemase
MMLSGESVDGQQAGAMGLVNRVCADEAELIPSACALAESCARHSFVPQRALRRLVRETAAMSITQGLDLEWKIGSEVASSHDAGEGVQAFVEKRPPKFQDR